LSVSGCLETGEIQETWNLEPAKFGSLETGEVYKTWNLRNSGVLRSLNSGTPMSGDFHE
jgi:hypothetical protein